MSKIFWDISMISSPNAGRVLSPGSNSLYPIFPEDVAFEKSAFNELSEECIIGIFNQLGLRELISISLSCRKFQRIADDQNFKSELDVAKKFLKLHLRFKENDFSYFSSNMEIGNNAKKIFSFCRFNSSPDEFNSLHSENKLLDLPNIFIKYPNHVEMSLDFIQPHAFQKIKEEEINNVFTKVINKIIQLKFDPSDFVQPEQEFVDRQIQFYTALRDGFGDFFAGDINHSIAKPDFDLCLDIEEKILFLGYGNRFFIFQKESLSYLTFSIQLQDNGYCMIKYVRIHDSEIFVGLQTGHLLVWDMEFLIKTLRNSFDRIFVKIFGVSNAELEISPEKHESVPGFGPKKVIHIPNGISSAVSSCRKFDKNLDEYLFLLDRSGILKVYGLAEQKLLHSFSQTSGSTSLAILQGGQVALLKENKIEILDFLSETPNANFSISQLGNNIYAFVKDKIFTYL